MWESVACAHTVILSGHTTFLVQQLYINTFQCYTQIIDIKFGIQTLLTYKLTILSIIISFVLENCIPVSKLSRFSLFYARLSQQKSLDNLRV